MRARALVGIILFSLLFILLLTATQASSVPPESAFKMVSLEEWYDFQPLGWVTSTLVTCAIKVYNESGFIDIGQYQYRTGGDWNAWTSDGLQITPIDATRRLLTVANLSFSHSLTENQNQIRFRIKSPLDVWIESGAYSVRVDTIASSSAVNTTGCYSTTWPGAITGIASDSGSGVNTVEITLRRNSDHRYYNGSSWQPTPVWLSATGTNNWAYPFTPGEDTYDVQSRATDVAGNQQTSYGQGTFTYDVTPPLSEVGTVGCFNNPDTWPGLLGLASDSLSGIAYVDIALQKDSLYYDGISWSPTITWLRASGTATWSFPFTPTEETRYTVKARATDGCGNVQSVYGEGVFTYDMTAPGPPYNLVVTPSGWSRTNSFTLAWNNPADLAGVEAAHYKWDAAPIGDNDESPGSPVPGPGIHSISGLMVPTQGTHQLFLWLEDACGNVDFQTRNATAVDAFKWDAVPPTTSITGLAGDQGCAGWYTSTVQVNISAVDVNPDPGRINATSGVSATFWRKDGGSWQRVLMSTFQIVGEGPHKVEYYSVDIAGNPETPPNDLTPTVKIDTVPPTTNPPSYTGTLGRNGWYTSTVTVALNAVDATSGVSVTYYQIDTGALQLGNLFNVATDGVHTIRYYSVDLACNQEAVQTAPVLKIDKTCPTTSYQLDGVPGDNGWFRGSPVTVTLRASDVVTGVQQTSGVDTLRYRIDGGSWQQYNSAFVVAVPPGQSGYVRTIEYYATDLAGNVEPTRVLTVGMDFEAPTAIPIMPSVSPPGWTKTNCFTITWEVNPADLSGINGAYYSFTMPISPTDGTLITGTNIMSIPCVQVPVELGDGWHNVYIWLRDKAGNSNHRAIQTVTLRLDQTPPRLTPVVTGNSCREWYNSPITVCFVATDTFSGMAGGVISYHVAGGGGWVEGSCYSESRDGRYTIEGRAMDAATNTSDVVTTTVRLDRTAPLAPIGMWVEPAGWSKENSFTISWLNPGDLSGVAGLYYKLGSLPISSTDGIYVEGSQSVLSISTTTEGEIPVYVWLVDKACNSDHPVSYTHLTLPTIYSV